MRAYLRVFVLSIFTLSVFPAFALSDYAMIIDGGSTGSRAHLFEYSYEDNTQTNIPVITDIFSESVKPGLSSFENHPEQAGVSLKKLLDHMQQKLSDLNIDPQKVSINILATAGMRLLTENQQQAVYENIKNYLQDNYPYAIGRIKTISGDAEALYGWLDINYLEENFQHKTPTLGSIDVGGASTQLAFEIVPPQNQTINAYRDKPAILKIGGQSYELFTHSFLGLGLEKALDAVSVDKNNNVKNTCYPKNYPINIRNNTSKGDFNFNNCAIDYADLLQTHKAAEKISLLPKSEKFAAYSGAFYTYHFLNADTLPKHSVLENKIQAVCNQSWEQLKQTYPKIPDNYLGSYCANAVYLDELLYSSQACHLKDRQLMVVDKINGKNIDWTLGALLYKLTASEKDF